MLQLRSYCEVCTARQTTCAASTETAPPVQRPLPPVQRPLPPVQRPAPPVQGPRLQYRCSRRQYRDLSRRYRDSRRRYRVRAAGTESAPPVQMLAPSVQRPAPPVQRPAPAKKRCFPTNTGIFLPKTVLSPPGKQHSLLEQRVSPLGRRHVEGLLPQRERGTLPARLDSCGKFLYTICACLRQACSGCRGNGSLQRLTKKATMTAHTVQITHNTHGSKKSPWKNGTWRRRRYNQIRKQMADRNKINAIWHNSNS